MGRRIIIKIIIPLLLILTIGSISFAKSNGILINDETFSLDRKENNTLLNFDSNFKIEKENNDNNYNLKEEIIELTKKTTYLLLGEANSENESSENYYKRHQDYLNLRYDPEIPKDENSFIGLDENSQEYKDDLLSGISVPGMFLMLSELDLKYSTYGDIRVTITDDINAIGMITLPNVTMKEQDENNPSEYNIIQTNLTMYYYFKKLNNEFKLLYIYGETENDIKEYVDDSDEKTGILSKDEDYNSQLKDLYDFGKVDAITDDILLSIYNENNSKIVFLSSTYNTGIVEMANGFFINEGLIITTYNYIEKSLMKAQNILIKDSLGTVYELDGIVTLDYENDIAILKIKDKNLNYIDIPEDIIIQKEDAVITLNSKIGVGLNTSKGIITEIDENIQTSLPVTEEMQGSPVFNSKGQLIGMINSETVNTSISQVTKSEIIKEYYNKLNEKDYDDIKAISFNELKENYYIKYSEEKEVNNIPEKKWEQFNEAENIEDFIGLKLIKSSYKDGIISLRYKNEISNYMDTALFAEEYKNNLKNKGYKEKNVSDVKSVYENENYQIIIMTEFDYLIIIMIKI